MSNAGDLLKCEARVQNALLICGPSGAGKSYFISAAINGELEPELLAQLPQNISQWQMVREKIIRERRFTADQIPSGDSVQSGIIFHYDTFFVHRIGTRDYFKDPISDFLFATANLSIVNIKPTAEQLKAQYDQRLRSQIRYRGYLRSFWRYTFQKPFNNFVYRFFGIGRPYTRDLYNQAGAIEECYRSWEAFLAELLRQRKNTHIIEIEPIEGRWRLFPKKAAL